MKKRARKAKKAIVIHPTDEGRKSTMMPFEVQVMPLPKISGVDELWRVAEAGTEWAWIAELLRVVPKALAAPGVLEMLQNDLAQCFAFLEHALRTGELPEINDCREDYAEAVIDCAQQILEMDARSELSSRCGVPEDALALLSSAREALAASKAEAEVAA